jgi:hypothetical protein
MNVASCTKECAECHIHAFRPGREGLKMQMVQEINLARVYDPALETICSESGPIKPTMWLIVSSETSAAPRAATR